MGWGAPGPAEHPPEDHPPAPVDLPWRRQDPRMLLVHPVRLAGSLLPLLLVVLFTNSGNAVGQLVSAGIAAVVAVLVTLSQYLTFRFRITEDTLEIRQGWLFRVNTTTRLERVRTVDIEGNVLMRVLRLRKVTLGTGVDDEQVEVEGLPVQEADDLRRSLLWRSQVARAEAAGPTAGGGPVATADPGAAAAPHLPADAPGEPEEAPAEEVLARWRPGWVRFGPLGGSGMLVAAAALGVFSQFADEIIGSAVGRAIGGRVAQVVENLGLWGFLAGALAAGVLVAALFSTIAYVVSWWGVVVERTGRGTLRVRRGLTTTRSNSMEERRIRGVHVIEPWQQRWQRGASLQALVTGAEGGSVEVLPVVHRDETRRLAVRVLDSGEDRATPVDLFDLPLVSHGPRALRRMAVGALVGLFWLGILPAAAGSALLWSIPDAPSTGWLGLPLVAWPWAWALAMAVLFLVPVYPAWRTLGHGVTDHHVYFRSGAILRHHLVLEKDGILGWVVNESFFQRRLGLCSVTATLAGGGEAHTLENLPMEDAVRLLRAASPELVGQFSRAA